MRLTDADALIKRWNEMTIRGRTEFDQELLLAPTVDPIRHGRWIRYISPIPEEDDGIEAWDCSECSAMVSYPTHYCPNCGSRMDKE